MLLTYAHLSVDFMVHIQDMIFSLLHVHDALLWIDLTPSIIFPSDTVYPFHCQALSPLPQAHISSLASSEPNSTIKIMHKVPMSPTFHQMGTWGCNNLSCLTFSGLFMLSDGCFHLI